MKPSESPVVAAWLRLNGDAWRAGALDLVELLVTRGGAKRKGGGHG